MEMRIVVMMVPYEYACVWLRERGRGVADRRAGRQTETGRQTDTERERERGGEGGEGGSWKQRQRSKQQIIARLVNFVHTSHHCHW